MGSIMFQVTVLHFTFVRMEMRLQFNDVLMVQDGFNNWLIIKSEVF